MLSQHFHFYHFNTGIAYIQYIKFIITNYNAFFKLRYGFMFVYNITRKSF